MKPTLLWLDDLRDPHLYLSEKDYDIVWVKSFVEFTAWITLNGTPEYVSFDHDLGEDLSGYDAVKFLASYCEKLERRLPSCTIHSANPVGRANIQSVIDTYNKVFDFS